MLNAMLTMLLSAAPLADGGCELWQGSLWGNDPRVKTRLDRPNPGWRSCLIDRYRLKLNEGTQVLEGSYFSSVCNDEAALSVERLAPGWAAGAHVVLREVTSPIGSTGFCQ